MRSFLSKPISKPNTTLAQNIINCEETVFTLDDAAEFLGKTREAIKKMCQRGTIPAHKKQRTWYLLKSEIVQQLRGL